MRETEIDVIEIGKNIKSLKKSGIFVIKASQAYIDPSINPKALASYGRLDVVARSAIAALIVRTGIRRDAGLYAVLEGRSRSLVLELDGESLRTYFRSEVEFGELLRQLVQGTPVSGATLYSASFEDLILLLLKRYGREHVYYLHESGHDISRLSLRKNSVFILGDHMGIDAQTERWLRSQGVTWLSLGSTPYFTEVCITFIHAVLDGFILP